MDEGIMQEEEKKKVITAFSTLLSYFEDNYKISKGDLLNIQEKKPSPEYMVPLSIFRGKCSPLESTIKYLKENLNISNAQVAILLNRSPKTVWASYSAGKNLQKESFEALPQDVFLPISIFQKNKLSILESIVKFLKQKNFRNHQIAEMLKRDQRTIWTVCKRIENKEKANAK